MTRNFGSERSAKVTACSRLTAAGIPLGLTDTPGRSAHAGEAIGQDNEYVFCELLGLRVEELREHIANGAVETADS